MTMLRDRRWRRVALAMPLLLAGCGGSVGVSVGSSNGHNSGTPYYVIYDTTTVVDLTSSSSPSSSSSSSSPSSSTTGGTGSDTADLTFEPVDVETPSGGGDSLTDDIVYRLDG